MFVYCPVRTESLNINETPASDRGGPASTPVSPLKFVRDEQPLRQVFLRTLRFSLVETIPPMLHALIDLHVVVTKKIYGRTPETCQKQLCFGNGKSDRKILPIFFSLTV